MRNYGWSGVQKLKSIVFFTFFFFFFFWSYVGSCGFVYIFLCIFCIFKILYYVYDIASFWWLFFIHIYLWYPNPWNSDIIQIHINEVLDHVNNLVNSHVKSHVNFFYHMWILNITCEVSNITCNVLFITCEINHLKRKKQKIVVLCFFFIPS